MGLGKKIRQALVGDLTSNDLPPTKQERDAWQKEREQQRGQGKDGKGGRK